MSCSCFKSTFPVCVQGCVCVWICLSVHSNISLVSVWSNAVPLPSSIKHEAVTSWEPSAETCWEQRRGHPQFKWSGEKKLFQTNKHIWVCLLLLPIIIYNQLLSLYFHAVWHCWHCKQADKRGRGFLLYYTASFNKWHHMVAELTNGQMDGCGCVLSQFEQNQWCHKLDLRAFLFHFSGTRAGDLWVDTDLTTNSMLMCLSSACGSVDCRRQRRVWAHLESWK